jgi:hypothetical protein
VVDCAGILNSQLAGHDGRVPLAALLVISRTSLEFSLSSLLSSCSWVLFVSLCSRFLWPTRFHCQQREDRIFICVFAIPGLVRPGL